jgi:uncharacterized membrane protein YesL
MRTLSQMPRALVTNAKDELEWWRFLSQAMTLDFVQPMTRFTVLVKCVVQQFVIISAPRVFPELSCKIAVYHDAAMLFIKSAF